MVSVEAVKGAAKEDTGKLNELIKALQAENKQLKKRARYGLVWEDKEEELDKKDVIPLLSHREDLSLPEVDGKPNNYLIEGDNYHALKALQHTHKGKIDVVYIDPPYNTGNNDFVYNDKMVDKEDGFRHSKWLSFMEKRLKLARNLMRDDGVIFVSIDDNEQAQLKLLMDAVFGEKNFVSNIPRLTSSQRPSQEKYISNSHDYVLVYVKSEVSPFNRVVKRVNNKVETDEIGTYVKGDTSPIMASSTQGYSLGGDYDVVINGRTYEPIDGQGNRRRWLWTKPRMEAALDLGIVVETGTTLRVRNYIDVGFEVGSNKLVTKNPNLILASFDLMNSKYTNEKGTGMLQSLGLKEKFDFSKPLDLLSTIISLHHSENATVLDFFAGSGTTGHAVMELNKEDGGNRSFILCTNNEVSDENERNYLHAQGLLSKNNRTEYNKYKKEHTIDYQAFLNSKEYQELGISRAVTRERVKRVIEGYTTPKGKEVEGLPNNLIYLQTHEFPKEQSTMFGRRKLVELALNSHYLKYPKTDYETIIVDVTFEIDKLDGLDGEKPLVIFLNVRDITTLKEYVDKLVGKFGNEIIIENFENYYEN